MSAEKPTFRLAGTAGVPILRKGAPTLGDPASQPGRGDPAAKLIVEELHQVGVALWDQLRNINYSLEALASPYALPHVPCVAPVVNADGDPYGYGVFCFACSYGNERRNSPELVYCQRDDLELDSWPPQRVVSAPEFTEEQPSEEADPA